MTNEEIISRVKSNFGSYESLQLANDDVERLLIVIRKQKEKKMTNLFDQLIEDMEFDVVIGWADILNIEHDEDMWLDDEWPDKEDELRVKVAEAMDSVGKNLNNSQIKP